MFPVSNTVINAYIHCANMAPAYYFVQPQFGYNELKWSKSRWPQRDKGLLMLRLHKSILVFKWRHAAMFFLKLMFTSQLHGLVATLPMLSTWLSVVREGGQLEACGLFRTNDTHKRSYLHVMVFPQTSFYTSIMQTFKPCFNIRVNNIESPRASLGDEFERYKRSLHYYTNITWFEGGVLAPPRVGY